MAFPYVRVRQQFSAVPSIVGVVSNIPCPDQRFLFPGLWYPRHSGDEMTRGFDTDRHELKYVTNGERETTEMTSAAEALACFRVIRSIEVRLDAPFHDDVDQSNAHDCGRKYRTSFPVAQYVLHLSPLLAGRFFA